MRYVGIDPGSQGAIGWIDTVGGGRGTVPLRKEETIIPALSSVIRWGDCPVYVENVPKGFGGKTTIPTMAVLHRNFGFILGALACSKAPPAVLVAPQTWQKIVPGLKDVAKDDKKDHMWEHAKECFPDITVYKYAADALLIAKWGSEQ